REGLVALPAIGRAIAGAIAEMVATGRWSQLERLRGELTPEALFRSIPGIGERLAHTLAEDGRLESLEDLEHAIHFGDLAVKGIGPRRKRMIAAAIAERLGRPAFARPREPAPPPVSLLLDVDRAYREKAAAGDLRRIAPKRFNPTNEAWLPSMHTRRGDWYFTALHSNTRLAHELGKTRDWVLIYHQRDGEPEGRCVVVTRTRGPKAGERVVRGREHEEA
ncbi:MAG TPA: DNA-binding protein, partial [Sinorhizobium sp.]|nr:DNA-binding protein [Sinorhizobium sp.]